MSDKSQIQEKDVLDMAWKYFQQHAQQRISYFNFFVVFSCLMTTAMMTTFQEKLEAHIVGVAVGIMQSFIAFTFWKIDERNKFLTRIGEETIKEFEVNYSFSEDQSYLEKIRLFSKEEGLTNKLEKSEKCKYFFLKQFSHSKSYKLFFVLFFFIGLAGAISSFYLYTTKGDMQASKSQQPAILIVNDSDKLIDINKKLDEMGIRLNDTDRRIIQIEKETEKSKSTTKK